jgi:ComF family protein
MIKKFNTWLQRLLPNYCMMCKAPTESAIALCHYCISQLPFAKGPRCQRCAIPLTTGSICGKCISKPPAFDHVICPLAYRPPIDHFIYQLKFNRKLIHAYVLGNLLADYIISTQHKLPELLIPIPLHLKRLRQRGFNQATEIARVISRKIHRPIDQQLIIRHKNTNAQATLKARERALNMRNAFQINKPKPYSRIALIDDVITTGETIHQACLNLKQSGINHIDVFAVARAHLKIFE